MRDEDRREIAAMEDKLEASIARIETKFDARLDALANKLSGGLRDVWQTLDQNKDRARDDNDRRHSEIMVLLRSMNGTVRSNTERIAVIEGERRGEFRFANIDPRRVAAGGVAGGAGLTGIGWVLWKAWEAWTSAGSPTP
jgi:hypothetical protein